MLKENIKTLRKSKGLSQEELATRLHVVRQTISKWEKNLSVPDADTLIRLAEILEVSVSELLGEKIENEKTGGLRDQHSGFSGAGSHFPGRYQHPAGCGRIKTGDRFHAGISEGCGRGCDRGNRVKRLYVRSTYCL